MIIAGVDPGSRVTGYGFIQMSDNRFRCLDYGSLAGGKHDFADRLNRIYTGLIDLLRRHQPDALVVEEVFHAVNARSALKLGHARGVVLLAAARAGIPIFEYAPLSIKKAVAGYGRADKVQIQMMVRTLLNLTETPQPHDAADALAAALCHAFSAGSYQRIQRQRIGHR